MNVNDYFIYVDNLRPRLSFVRFYSICIIGGMIEEY